MVEQIVLNKISKSYVTSQGQKKLPVLNNLSIKIQKGEFVSILGPNGCGKSTLLRIIAGLDSADSGKVLFHGIDQKNMKVGYLPQSNNTLLPWFNSKENIAFALSDSKSNNDSIALNKLADFWISDYALFYPYQLSGGLKQMVGIARASAISDILLFDEPLTGLDQSNSKIVENAFFKLKDGNNTAVIVSHDIDTAVLFSDKIVILSEKPSSIVAVISVGLGPRRTSEMRYSDAFLGIRKQVYEILTRGQ
ncbi:MAG: ABC transporter ATP-binding protein [archaeon]|jgi:ABC-type nitrate/sulfonate/bicarbonate transport system ATPase subunit